jgi:hypothetical protein
MMKDPSSKHDFFADSRDQAASEKELDRTLCGVTVTRDNHREREQQIPNVRAKRPKRESTTRHEHRPVPHRAFIHKKVGGRGNQEEPDFRRDRPDTLTHGARTGETSKPRHISNYPRKQNRRPDHAQKSD